MKLTIGQAAKETGKSKSTISRAIKTGRISAQKTGDRYEIDPAELFRAFPPATGAQPSQSNDTQPPSPTPSQPDPATEEGLRLIDWMLRTAAMDRGLTADSVSIDNTAQSGAAKEIDSWELMELRADDIEALRSAEKEIFEVTRAVWNENSGGRAIPDTAVFGIDFDPIAVPLDPAEDMKVKELRAKFGLWTPVDDMIDEDEGIDKEKALELILDNLDIMGKINERKAASSPFGNAVPGKPGAAGPGQTDDNATEERDADMAASA